MEGENMSDTLRWKTLAQHYEAEWGRCSQACAKQQGRAEEAERKLAEARAENERLRSVANRGGHLAVANAEIERLRDDLNRVTNGTWSKEIARLSKANAEARAENERLRSLWFSDSDPEETEYASVFAEYMTVKP